MWHTVTSNETWTHHYDPENQWRIQDFHKGYAEQGIWGTEVPQWGPGAEPRWGLGAKPPEARDIMLNSQLKTSKNFNIKT